MKRILACLVCVVAVVGAGWAWAMTYEEATEAVREKLTACMKANNDMLELCNALIEDGKSDSRVRAFGLASRGRYYFLINAFDWARTDLEASIKLDDSIPGGYLGLGELARNRGDFSTAVDNFKKAESKNPSDGLKKWLQEAIVDAQKKLEAQPKQSQKPQAEPQKTKTALPEYNTAAHCKDVSEAGGGSYTIESGCIKMENRAREKLMTRDIEPRVLKHCDEVAQAGGGSYVILQGCIDMEMKSKKNLGK